MKLTVEISDEMMRTGEIHDKCRGCSYAKIIDGENVEFPVMFCLRMFDFPVKHYVVKELGSKLYYEFTEKVSCDGKPLKMKEWRR